MAKVVAYPGCCTGVIIVGFGGSVVGEPEHNINGWKIDNTIEGLNKVKLHYENEGYAFLSAVTNSQQTEANKILKEAGFIKSRWMSKPNHPETQVATWFFELNPKTEEKAAG